MLDEVCRRLRSWLDAGMAVTPVSVNQSRRLLYQPDYVRTLEQTLERHGISPALIVLEITESIAMENLEAFKRVVSRLHGQGFRISMDDFGSGYSSLNVLKDIPVDELKLDRVFLSSAKDEARRDTIVRHVIRLAEDLGITTVSEGVETDEQVAFLRACGCDIAQGFYFAKPMPPEELENRLLTTRSGAGAARCLPAGQRERKFGKGRPPLRRHQPLSSRLLMLLWQRGSFRPLKNGRIERGNNRRDSPGRLKAAVFLGGSGKKWADTLVSAHFL